MPTVTALLLNGTDNQERDGTNARSAATMYEFRVFNITVLVLAVCILAVTAAVCCVSYYRRRRRCKRARVYESGAWRDRGEELEQVEVEVARSRSFSNPLALLRPAQPPRDNARVYYIHSDALPDALPDAHRGDNQAPPTTLQDHAHPSVLVLHTFYMQL